MIQKLFAQSAFLRFAFCTCATMTGMQSPLFCQRVKWEISGTTEGLWNITDGKTGWCNLLEVSAETGLWKNAQLETAAISTYNLGIPVAGDLQAFSCIDAGPDKAFRLIEAGIRQNIGDKGSVYAGLRNIDMDHFTTPFTALCPLCRRPGNRRGTDRKLSRMQPFHPPAGRTLHQHQRELHCGSTTAGHIGIRKLNWVIKEDCHVRLSSTKHQKQTGKDGQQTE